MTSTTGLVDEMLGSLRDQEADVDKKTQVYIIFYDIKKKFKLDYLKYIIYSIYWTSR